MLQSAIFSHKTMKNAIFSCLSSYSYSNSGCNEVMTETPSISSNLVFNDDSLCFYGDFSSNHDQSSYNVLVPGSTENSQGGTQFSYMPVQDDIFYQPWESSYVQPSYNEIHFIQNAGKKDVSEKNIARKRSAEAGGSCSLTKSATNERDQLKKRPAHFQGKLSNIQKEKEPKSRRRSQKLTDKITALQKLVSPYGKTDTASVLLEASISIKALQDQIEEIFHNISGERTTNMTGDKRSDLQSRGLSLVPTGILEELDKRLPIHCHHH